MKVEAYEKKAVFVELKEFCHHVKEGDFIEVTRWYNWEGYDVIVGDQKFSLTEGQLKALNFLLNHPEL
jgi:hypothetical protein